MISSIVALLLAGAPTVFMNAHIPSTADAQSMKALGASGVRMDFNWYDFQPEANRYEWGYLDAAVQAARANGLSIYASVAYTPQWASTMPTCVPLGSDDATKCGNKLPVQAAWTQAVTQVVTRYRGQVDCWGIWNEPNLRTFFDGTLDQFVTTIFIPAANAIRAADPQARICGPELAHLAASSNWNGRNGTCAFGSCIRNGWELDLSQMLDRVGPYLDVITHHNYKADAAGTMTSLLDGEYQVGVLVHDSVKHVIASKGYANKEFWLTEVGWEHGPQGSMALPDVATRIADLYAKQEEVCAGTYAASLNDAWPVWTRTYYFHFPYDPGSGWGIVDQSGAPLAPYSALQNWARNRTTTACGRPTITPDAGVPPVIDAGTPPPVDAGTHPVVDAGSPPPVDAGTPPIVVDSGTPLTNDAGTPPPSDAGSTQGVDAGTTPPPPGQGDPIAEPPPAGCGCSSWSGAWVVLALALARRRRLTN
ncbi:MAG: beta-galactosidase [Myxococcaceae bacterium]